MLRTRTVLSLLAVSAALSRGTRAGDTELPPPPAVLARVGQTLITRADLYDLVGEGPKALSALRDREIEKGESEEEAGRRLAQRLRQLEREAREVLLQRALIEESARQSGYLPEEMMIEVQILRAAYKAGGVEELVRESGRTVEQMREGLRQKDLQRRFLTDRLPQGVTPGPAEIRASYRADPPRRPPLWKLRVLEVPAGPDREESRYEAEAIKRELRYDPGRFMKKARDLARTEEEKAAAGLVMDPRTGKPVEWIDLRRIPRGVAEAIMHLKPGEVSEVIPEEKAFLLVKVVDRKPPEPFRLQEVIERILARLQLKRKNDVFREWSDYYLREVYVADGNGRRISVESFVGLPAAQTGD